MSTPDKAAVMLAAQARDFTVRIARDQAGVIEPPEDQHFSAYGATYAYLSFQDFAHALEVIKSATPVECPADCWERE